MSCSEKSVHVTHELCDVFGLTEVQKTKCDCEKTLRSECVFSVVIVRTRSRCS